LLPLLHRRHAEKVAGFVDSHLDDVLLRQQVEVALELAFELAEGQLAHGGKIDDSNSPPGNGSECSRAP